LISTISQALVILGLNSVRTLALGFTLVGNFKNTGGEQFDPNVVWRRSLYSAVGTRCIAKEVGMAEHEEAFLAGLLQDLGVLAMIQTIGPDYVQLLCEIGDDHRELWRAEAKRFDVNHAQIGEALALRWKLPPILSTPICHHEQPGNAPADLRNIVRAVHLGALAADVYLGGESQEALNKFLSMGKRWFDIGIEPGRDLLKTIGGGTRELAKLFDITTGKANNINEILADANDLLLDLSLQAAQNASALEAENRHLQRKVTRDPLTGIGNRGHFNTSLRRFFDHAQRQSSPVSLVLIDADKFKPLNDTYGHLAGDRALVTLANLLRDHSPENAA
ncbi:MAG: HDOD domain-containing protein, partial [Phycisphaeraceae bacterium]